MADSADGLNFVSGPGCFVEVADRRRAKDNRGSVGIRYRSPYSVWEATTDWTLLGLASAISLKKSGHNVLVLEKDSQLGGADSVCLNRSPGCHVSL
jgi:hypothetical protein